MAKRLNEASVRKAIADAAAGQTRDVSDDGAPGLVLRVAPRGASWAFRSSRAGNTIRLRLGSLDLLSLTEARELAGAAMTLLKEGREVPREGWLQQQLVMRKIIEEPAPAPLPPLPVLKTWTYAQAKDAYLAVVKRTRREATWIDKRNMLKISEVEHLLDRPVGAISLAQMASIVADIHATGRERYAGKLAECIRPMWSWLALPAQQLRSGVLGTPMADLAPPEDTNVEHQTNEDDDDGAYLPLPAELGRLLALTRAGVMHGTMADASLLLLFTSQRRRTVVNARRSQFGEEDGVLIWKIPARFRKTGRTKKKLAPRSHDLPLSAEAAAMVRRRLAEETESPWLFPAIRPRRADAEMGHLGPDALTHAFADLPGIIMSPHDTRRGFTTHLEDALGFDQQILKVVLDHSEGKSSRDVTDASYSKARRLKLKATILEAWAGFLIEQADKVTLEDTAAIKKAITASRNERARLSARNPRPKRSRPGRYKPKIKAA